jgi:uncharacterized protein with PQ loop repeat
MSTLDQSKVISIATIPRSELLENVNSATKFKLSFFFIYLFISFFLFFIGGILSKMVHVKKLYNGDNIPVLGCKNREHWIQLQINKCLVLSRNVSYENSG